jgi:LysR family transcriptional regulator, carnitine catabolism transcriptional activator
VSSPDPPAAIRQSAEAENQHLETLSVTDAALRDAMLLKVSWLRSFLAVAESGGFGAATIKLHLSQSRVSAHIADLESALGFSLFERRVRPTTLTAPGEIFRGYAKNALQQLQEGIEAARSTIRPGYGHLIIGSYPSVSSVFLPAVLSGLRNDYPEISVELVEGTASTLESALVQGTVDVAFRPTQPPMRDPGLCMTALWREPIVAVMRGDHPLAELASVKIADLEGRALIGNPAGSEEDGGGFDLRHAAGEAASAMSVAYLTDQPATLVALVHAAFGIGVISQLALGTTSTEGLVSRPLDSLTAFRDVAIFWNERRKVNPSLHAFVAAVARAELPAGVSRIPG